MTNQNINPVELAKAKLGSQKKIADSLNVSKQAVSAWKRNGVPAQYVNKLSDLTGIPRWIINPSLYPPEKEFTSQTF